jgi:pyrroline-5-carboxylate reductase
MKNYKIAIIGCGNLGLSILNGLLDQQDIQPSHIIVTRRNTHALEHLKERGIKVSDDNISAVKSSEIIILALKPYNILDVLDELNTHFDSNKHILVSLATGVSLLQIQNVLTSPLPLFRAMPNTAADVGMSMTCISSSTDDKESINIVQQCFNSIGETIIIDEELMDSATVLGACGIAYVLRFIRGMIQGGIQIGFDAKTASHIVTNTVKGAAELLIKRNEHPEYEIDKVTTPKGCTIAGLNEMEHNGFSSALIKGIVTSYDKIEKKPTIKK